MKATKKTLVRGDARKQVARPQPPMRDRRLRRERTRAAVKRAALRDA